MHSDFGLYTLKHHSFDHMAEDIQGFGTLYVLGSSSYEDAEVTLISVMKEPFRVNLQK